MEEYRDVRRVAPVRHLEKLSRCWFHVITEVRHISERNEDGADTRRVLGLLRCTFREVKKKRPVRNRPKDHGLLSSRIKRMVSRCGGSPLLGSFMVKLKNTLSYLFTFVLDPRVLPTNNAAARARARSQCTGRPAVG